MTVDKLRFTIGTEAPDAHRAILLQNSRCTDCYFAARCGWIGLNANQESEQKFKKVLDKYPADEPFDEAAADEIFATGSAVEHDRQQKSIAAMAFLGELRHCTGPTEEISDSDGHSGSMICNNPAAEIALQAGADFMPPQ